MSSEHHPSSEQVLKVVEVFDRICEREGTRRKVHMFEAGIYTRCPVEDMDDNYCGTIACHGGHFALQCAIDGTTTRPDRLDEAPLKWPNKKRWAFHSIEFDYDNGKAEMAKMLGFTEYLESAVSDYYADHPELWGNGRGGSMFGAVEAFGERFIGGYDEAGYPVEFTKLRIKHIRNHWRKVYKRTLKRERDLAEARGG